MILLLLSAQFPQQINHQVLLALLAPVSSPAKIDPKSAHQPISTAMTLTQATTISSSPLQQQIKLYPCFMLWPQQSVLHTASV